MSGCPHQFVNVYRRGLVVARFCERCEKTPADLLDDLPITDCGESPECRQCAWNAGTLAVTARREGRKIVHEAAVRRFELQVMFTHMMTMLGVAPAPHQERVNSNLFAGREVSYKGMKLSPLPGDYWQLTGPGAPPRLPDSHDLWHADNLRQQPFALVHPDDIDEMRALLKPHSRFRRLLDRILRREVD